MIGGLITVIGADVDITLGYNVDGKSLEDITKPITARSMNAKFGPPPAPAP